MVQGKAKGNAYEIEKCRQISLWISNGERDDLVWRSASSGAVFTVRSRKKAQRYETQAGDIASIHELSAPFLNRFALELKRYKDLQLENLVCATTSKAREFWNVHAELCQKVNREPLCIMKQDRKPDLIFFPSRYARLVSQDYGVYCVVIPHAFAVAPLEGFLSHIPHEDMLYWPRKS